jgi:hypothetical protein
VRCLLAVTPTLCTAFMMILLTAMVGIAHMSRMTQLRSRLVGLIIDAALGDVALAADLEKQLDGLLLPAKLFDDTAEDTAIVVVKPQNYTVTPSNSATAPVQGADNPVLGSILRSDYTTASEAAAGRLAAAAGARQEVDVARTSIASRISELTAQKRNVGNTKGATTAGCCWCTGAGCRNSGQKTNGYCCWSEGCVGPCWYH